jgi:hypothetical protein
MCGVAIQKQSLTLEEVGLETTCYGSCEQRLSSAGRSVEQNTLRRLDTHTQEQLGVLQRKLDDLAQFSDLVVQSTNTAE